jgi:hypothetical protein
VFVATVNPLELVARTAIVYAVFILVLRAFGKRELGQFTIFDLALLLLAANALQPAMTGPDTSVGGGPRHPGHDLRPELGHGDGSAARSVRAPTARGGADRACQGWRLA